MTLDQAISLGGATILVGILVETLKRTLAWGQAQVDRFGPLVAILVGILVVVLLTTATDGITTPAAFAAAIVTGVIAGASAAGLYQAAPDSVKNIGRSDAGG